MTFSRTHPPPPDDGAVPSRALGGTAGSQVSGAERLRRLRSIPDPAEPETADPERWIPDAPLSDDRAPRARPTPDAGWTDGPPTGTVPSARHSPLDAVAAAYTAANGHPTSHSGFEHVPDGGPRRWSVGARAAVVTAVLVLLLAVGVGARSLAGGDDLRPVAALETPDSLTSSNEGSGSTSGVVPGAGTGGGPAPGADGGAAATKPGAGTGATGVPGVSDVVVHVVGAVTAPGLVTLPEGARVADALTAAGDATAEADLAGLNLAREVVDGEQIVVPRPGEIVAVAPGPGPGSSGAGTGLVDLNSADEAALDALSGIGPVLAARILAWRETNGRFTSVDELGEVSGIGDALLAKLRDQVRV